MDVLDARYKLLVHSDCQFSCIFKGHNIIEKFAILGIHHDQEKFALSLDNFVKIDDVGVPDLLEDLDLSTDSLDILLIFDT